MIKPTIGIEIELPWQFMLDRVDPEAAAIFRDASSFWNLTGLEKQRVQQGFDAVDAEYKERMNDVFGDEIAKGNDSFTEFALRPKAEAEALVEVTGGLYGEDLLRDEETYSLHVTLGNTVHCRSAWMVLMAAEISGGTTPVRLVQQGTWDRKGQAGILFRQPVELVLDSTHGFEMRTLVLQNTEQLSQTLHVAQSVGELLAAREIGIPYATERLRYLSEHLLAATREKGIDISVPWPNPSYNLEPWLKISQALGDSVWRETIEKGILELL